MITGSTFMWSSPCVLNRSRMEISSINCAPALFVDLAEMETLMEDEA